MPIKMVIISGKMGSGKTSIQRRLTESLRRNMGTTSLVMHMNFADILYEMHDKVLDVLHRYWPKRNIAKDGPLLQLLGTEWGRKTVDENIWVRCLQKKVEMWDNDQEHTIIIGDCRFENEFDAFPDALRIRLNCPKELRKERCSMWRENDNHASEIGLDSYAKAGKFDMYIDTKAVGIEGCVSLIKVALDKNSWIERRRK